MTPESKAFIDPVAQELLESLWTESEKTIRNQIRKRIQAEAKIEAEKCVRIAQFLLGPDATPQELEDKALELMDLR